MPKPAPTTAEADLFALAAELSAGAADVADSSAAAAASAAAPDSTVTFKALTTFVATLLPDPVKPRISTPLDLEHNLCRLISLYQTHLAALSSQTNGSSQEDTVLEKYSLYVALKLLWDSNTEQGKPIRVVVAELKTSSVKQEASLPAEHFPQRLLTVRLSHIITKLGWEILQVKGGFEATAIRVLFKDHPYHLSLKELATQAECSEILNQALYQYATADNPKDASVRYLMIDIAELRSTIQLKYLTVNITPLIHVLQRRAFLAHAHAAITKQAKDHVEVVESMMRIITTQLSHLPGEELDQTALTVRIGQAIEYKDQVAKHLDHDASKAMEQCIGETSALVEERFTGVTLKVDAHTHSVLFAARRFITSMPVEDLLALRRSWTTLQVVTARIIQSNNLPEHFNPKTKGYRSLMAGQNGLLLALVRGTQRAALLKLLAALEDLDGAVTHSIPYKLFKAELLRHKAKYGMDGLLLPGHRLSHLEIDELKPCDPLLSIKLFGDANLGEDCAVEFTVPRYGVAECCTDVSQSVTIGEGLLADTAHPLTEKQTQKVIKDLISDLDFQIYTYETNVGILEAGVDSTRDDSDDAAGAAAADKTESTAAPTIAKLRSKIVLTMTTAINLRKLYIANMYGDAASQSTDPDWSLPSALSSLITLYGGLTGATFAEQNLPGNTVEFSLLQQVIDDAVSAIAPYQDDLDELDLLALQADLQVFAEAQLYPLEGWPHSQGRKKRQLRIELTRPESTASRGASRSTGNHGSPKRQKERKGAAAGGAGAGRAEAHTPRRAASEPSPGPAKPKPKAATLSPEVLPRADAGSVTTASSGSSPSLSPGSSSPASPEALDSGEGFRTQGRQKKPRNNGRRRRRGESTRRGGAQLFKPEPQPAPQPEPAPTPDPVVLKSPDSPDPLVRYYERFGAHMEDGIALANSDPEAFLARFLEGGDCLFPRLYDDPATWSDDPRATPAESPSP